MSYYQKLAFELRMRGQSEEKVEDVLREVDEFAHDSGSAPEEEFGSAAELAGRYPASRRMTAGHWIFTTAVGVAVVVYVGNLLLRDSGGVGVPAWAMFVVLLVLVAGAAGVATAVNRRLPQSFVRSRRGTS